jgi:hypothetical protein
MPGPVIRSQRSQNVITQGHDVTNIHLNVMAMSISSSQVTENLSYLHVIDSIVFRELHQVCTLLQASSRKATCNTNAYTIIIIQLNSIQFIYVQNLTAQRPITKLAQARKWEE